MLSPTPLLIFSLFSRLNPANALAPVESGRWRTALLERVKHRRPIRPRATMMARRMSAGLIAVLPQIPIQMPAMPGIPSREEVLGYVRGLA
jgi:hypothetical protein